MARKHPKQLRAEKKARQKMIDIAEEELIENLTRNIRIEIDREIIDNLKKTNETKATTS